MTRFFTGSEVNDLQMVAISYDAIFSVGYFINRCSFKKVAANGRKGDRFINIQWKNL